MSEPAAPRPPGAPWIRPEVQQAMAWRDGDVVISVPPKSGTTWTMNIVHQLFAGGTADFDDIYAQVPWIEFVARPDQPLREILDRLDAMPRDRRRAFKTHSAPPQVPYFPAGSGPKVSYLVVMRNPEEALVSFWPFLAAHADAWLELWGLPAGALARPDFPSFYRDVVAAQGMAERALFGFADAWWPLRNEANVLLLHYRDMKREHEASIRAIAGFLGVEPDPAQWSRILEYTSFDWMKRHEHKFEAGSLAPIPVLGRGSMIRRGKAGEASADGMTDAIAEDLRRVGAATCADPAALAWLYDGRAA